MNASLWSKYFDSSDKISQHLVLCLPSLNCSPKIRRPQCLTSYPADRQLNYFAFSRRPKWNIISRLRFKLKPWQEPCLGRPAETFQPPLPLLTPVWHMGWIRKHEPCDVTTNWPRGDRFWECFAHWPQARVKYVYVVHVDFIWSGIISSQTLNCDSPPWETRAWQETVCFCNQQTGINY